MQYMVFASGAALMDCLSTAERASSQTMELVFAAAEVMARRMTLGGFAMVDPAHADHDEFARMVPEKTRAFADAGCILVNRSSRIGQQVTGFIAEEMTRAADAAATGWSHLAGITPGGVTPLGTTMAQANASLSQSARFAALPGALCLLALQAHAAVMAPIHRAATDNVQRLRRPDVGPG